MVTIDDLLKTAYTHPDEETVMQTRANAFRELGDTDRAIGAYHRAIGMKPTFVGARRELGKLYEKLERFDLAEEVFREIPVANPDYAAGPMSLALYLARREEWDEAERIFVATWPRLPGWGKSSIRNQPDAAPLLERTAVRAVVETED